MSVHCSNEPNACPIICDFCIYFKPLGGGDGRCLLHEKPTEADRGCENFHCFKAELPTK